MSSSLITTVHRKLSSGRGNSFLLRTTIGYVRTSTVNRKRHVFSSIGECVFKSPSRWEDHLTHCGMTRGPWVLSGFAGWLVSPEEWATRVLVLHRSTTREQAE